MTESLLLTGARLPGAGGSDRVELLIDGGVITQRGELGELAAPSGTRVVDLGGRFVIPGLWDKHVHATQWALVSRRLDLSEATSAADVARLVGERLRGPLAPTSGDALVGYGFRDGLWPDAPDRRLLDAVAGSRPVVLVGADLHCCWLNSAALLAHGHADSDTGLLIEEDSFAVTRTLANVAPEVLDASVRDACDDAASRGVVGIVDLEMAWNLDDWTRRIRGGNTALRVRFGVYAQHLERAIGLGMFTGQPVANTDGLLECGPFKVITDGSLNTRTAYCFEEYPGLEGEADSRGLLTIPAEVLVPLLRRAAGAGFVPAVHAIGDHANRLALDAFEVLGVGGSIEHAQLVQGVDVARFAALGVTAGVQPEHAMDDRDVAELFWAGRTERAFALRSLLDAGAVIALGSDAPVAPLDPWVSIAAAVGRSRDGRAPWHPEQSITPQEALVASADGRSALELGEPADLAVVEIDPFRASVDELRRMPVAATLLAGRFTHDALS